MPWTNYARSRGFKSFYACVPMKGKNRPFLAGPYIVSPREQVDAFLSGRLIKISLNRNEIDYAARTDANICTKDGNGRGVRYSSRRLIKLRIRRLTNDELASVVKRRPRLLKNFNIRCRPPRAKSSMIKYIQVEHV